MQEELYEDYCTRNGITTDAPVVLFLDRLRSFQHQRASQARDRVRPVAPRLARPLLFRMLTPSRVGQASSPQKLEQLTHRLDVFDDITTRLVPTDMLSQVRLATKERRG